MMKPVGPTQSCGPTGSLAALFTLMCLYMALHIMAQLPGRQGREVLVPETAADTIHAKRRAMLDPYCTTCLTV